MRIERSSSGQYIILNESEQRVASANTFMEAIQASNRAASKVRHEQQEEKKKAEYLQTIITDYVQSDS